MMQNGFVSFAGFGRSRPFRCSSWLPVRLSRGSDHEKVEPWGWCIFSGGDFFGMRFGEKTQMEGYLGGGGNFRIMKHEMEQGLAPRRGVTRTFLIGVSGFFFLQREQVKKAHHSIVSLLHASFGFLISFITRRTVCLDNTAHLDALLSWRRQEGHERMKR